MKEQLITYETAKLAKEKMIKVDCSLCGVFGGQDKVITQSLLQKWLRDEPGIYVEVSRVLSKHMLGYCYRACYNNLEGITSILTDEYSTYELALEKGLQEALKLIKT